MRIIQQWQYNGEVLSGLMSDEAFRRARDAGITTLQSYVPWSNVEPSEGVWDFSLYDPLIEKILRHGLLWAPFLILGPGYSIPEWFQRSPQSVPARCVEHGTDCSIQSIWNPHIRQRVDTFLDKVSAHFSGSGVIETALLGISGNWGESIFPVDGGFVQDAHMHLGWWCGDEHALADFRRRMIEKYGKLDAINQAWGTGFGSLDDVRFNNEVGASSWKVALHHAGYRALGWLPRGIKTRLKSALHRHSGDTEISGAMQRQLDFTRWYVSSMTDYADFWLSSARRAFPDVPLYLVTGGDGHPMGGADFFRQAEVVAKHNAGIRATSLTDGYGASFFLSRSASAPCRFYGAGFETEEAGIQRTEGIAMRLFDAITSGAEGMYCKSLMGYGRDFCTGINHEPGARTRCTDEFELHSGLLGQGISGCRPSVAVLHPTTAIMLDHYLLTMLKDFCGHLRTHMDFDIVDEGMILDRALEGYSALVVFSEFHLPQEVSARMDEWINAGGLCIRARGSGGQKVLRRGEGHELLLPGGHGFTRATVRSIRNEGGSYPWAKSGAGDKWPPGVYVSKCSSGCLVYNSLQKQCAVSIDGNMHEISGSSIRFISR